MTNRRTEEEPATVSRAQRGTRPDGEIRDRWSWVEPNVWTDRMLTALERGVKGGKWHSLIDKVYSAANLRAAFAKVKANRGSAGVDRQTIAGFEADLEENLAYLTEVVRRGTYRPKPIHRVWIPKPGKQEKRPLGIPTIRDRVVQTALRNVLEPIFERDFAEHSYGFRPGRGCKDALRRVAALLKEGYIFVVDADLKSYFDTIDHERLLDLVRGKVSDTSLLSLLNSYLTQEVMDTAGGWTPERGTPQGAVISPLLSNLYLDPLDHLAVWEGLEMVRYADDFVILCRTQADASSALQMVATWTNSVGLTLHPEKTRVVNATEPGGFDFLGYHFEQGRRWPSSKSLKKFKDTIRSKTSRSCGTRLRSIIHDLNRTLVGWFAYFQHSYKPTFGFLDGWIRMRLRSILRRRSRRRGRGRGWDHIRWPNVFFAERGLFSLRTAHALASQPRKG
ncbi:MAG: group II intron reverse transcriptase/maturase [Acidobacteriota bacterium]